MEDRENRSDCEKIVKTRKLKLENTVLVSFVEFTNDR